MSVSGDRLCGVGVRVWKVCKFDRRGREGDKLTAQGRPAAVIMKRSVCNGYVGMEVATARMQQGMLCSWHLAELDTSEAQQSDSPSC